MVPRHHSRFWRLCRIYFRRFRITVWLGVLAVLGCLLYLNQIGLPDFAKRPLLEKLRARGVEMQFSRLRLRWYEGIVAENVHFGRAAEPLGPQLSLREVQVRLNWPALARLQLQVDSLRLRQGRLVWPVAQTNAPQRQLVAEELQTELRFLPNDQWELDHFKVSFAGAHFELSGVVTNASSVRDWKLPHPQGGTNGPVDGLRWQRRLSHFAETLEQIHFSAPPEFHLDVRGDARDLQSFSVLMLLAAPGAQTPWGTVSQGHFRARLFPADTNGAARAELHLEAVDAKTHWADITDFHLNLRLTSVEGQTNLVSGDLQLSARQAHTPWAGATNALFSAQWVHALTNPVPLSGQGRLVCEQVQSRWAGADHLELSGRLATPVVSETTSCDPALSWWTNLQPYRLEWESRLTGLRSTQAVAEEMVCSGSWAAPQLTLSNLEARLYGGRLEVHGQLDTLRRQLRARLASDFDPHRIEPLLSEGGRRWLEQFSWETPPELQAEAALVLPAWTNAQPDWRAEVQPTLDLRGQFNLKNGGAYRQVPVASASSHFLYSNLCWHLPDLVALRPEGRLQAEHRANDRTKEYYWHLSSSVDPTILRPVLEPAQARVLDLFDFSQPPVLEAEIWGQFHDPARTGAKGRLALTNFSFRGQTAAGLQTAFQYTNQVLQCFQPRLQRAGTERASAEGLRADFQARLLFLTNGFSTVEPMCIARAIGPHIVRAIEAYQFLTPPTARVYGVIPLRDEEDADLHFEVSGGPFHWWKFNLAHAAGQLHWQGLRLTLTNLQADFYGGQAGGSARFDFVPHKPGTDFQFRLAATNARLQGLMADLARGSNHLEGRLSGHLVISQANTEDWRSVQGSGDVNLRDGLIWDIPIFGIFSPVLDGVAPGLGHSRASAGTGTFTITDGQVRSDDLEIRSPALRLLYHGTVDLESRVQARVEAAPLRDVRLLGPVVSTIFWPMTKLFEYDVSGTLSDPKTQPVFILPRLMLFPFHPMRTIKGLLPEDPGARTNGAALFEDLAP